MKRKLTPMRQQRFTLTYAEVCVPAFAEQVTPVTLAVKEVVDNDYCLDRLLTICEETNTVVQREICTNVSERSGRHPNRCRRRRS